MAPPNRDHTSAPTSNGTSADKPSANQIAPRQNGIASSNAPRAAGNSANVNATGNERANPPSERRPAANASSDENTEVKKEGSREPDVASTRRGRNHRSRSPRHRQSGPYRQRENLDRRNDHYVPSRPGYHVRGRSPPIKPEAENDRHYRPAPRRPESRERARNSSSRERRQHVRNSSSRERRQRVRNSSSRERRQQRDRPRNRDDDRYRVDRNNRYRDYRERAERRRRSRSRSPRRSPVPDDETDRRTVFVQQLANRVTETLLREFFDSNGAGPVHAATIVRDKVSNRSKGIGYVQFKKDESVEKALKLTGRSLCDMPVIVQLTEAEKNRQARAAANANSGSTAPFHRLYVGNVHFSITEDDLRKVFEVFGEITMATLQRDEGGRSRGYGFVQYVDPDNAKKALDQMNGFDLAGRMLRVGLGNDKTPDAAMARVGPQSASAFSGAGGRGVHAGGQQNYERAAHRETERIGGASALDDTDVGNVNHHAFDRHALMLKLAHLDNDKTEDGATKDASKPNPDNTPLTQRISRCIVINDAFETKAEDKIAPSGSWVRDIEDDVEGYCEENFGEVVHVKAVRSQQTDVDEEKGEKPDDDGRVFVKFRLVPAAEKAYKSLQGRQFNGGPITAQYVPEGQYNLLHRLTG